MIYKTDSVLLDILAISNFPLLQTILQYTPCTWTFVNISGYFLKLKELLRHGILKSKKKSIFKVLKNTVRQPSRKVVPIYIHPQSRERESPFLHV